MASRRTLLWHKEAFSSLPTNSQFRYTSDEKLQFVNTGKSNTLPAMATTVSGEGINNQAIDDSAVSRLTLPSNVNLELGKDEFRLLRLLSS